VSVVCGNVDDVKRDMDFDPLSSGGSIIIRRPNLVKKKVRIEVETSGKIWGYVAGEGEFENRVKNPRGTPKRGQKIMGPGSGRYGL